MVGVIKRGAHRPDRTSCAQYEEMAVHKADKTCDPPLLVSL